MAGANKKYAVVTGGNRGIGFEICRQLASNRILVILAARDEKRGLEAAEKLQQCGLSEYLLFHQLDVTNADSVASLAEFIKNRFGKLDILVNNAAVLGVISDADAMKAFVAGSGTDQEMASQRMTETYELAEECLNTNYYSTKRMIKALLPLLQLSDAPKVVNVSSTRGKLEYVKNEWGKEVLGDAGNLTEERVDEVVKEYLKDFKEGSLNTKNWAVYFSAYRLSKAAVNAYTRIAAKEYTSVCINSVCPGHVKTDLNHNTGYLSAKEGAESAVRLALLPKGAPSGCFFNQKDKSPF